MDKNQMEQVFLNVLKNAVEAIGQEGTITVKVLPQDILRPAPAISRRR